MDKEPLEVEGAAVVAAQGGELEGVAQGSLQADDEAPARLGMSGQGEVEPLRPIGLAPERLNGKTIEQDSRGKQQQRRKDIGKGGAGGKQQSGDKWSPGFKVDTGGAELGLEVEREPSAPEDTVVVATPGGEVERASWRLASKRKREDELTQQPTRHSLWEQGSPEPHNEWMSGCLDGEVVALQQRKAEYDEERWLSEGSDSCWSGADSDTDSAAELEVDKEPLKVEGAAVLTIVKPISILKWCLS